jgi:hypothetical protein
MLPISSWTLRSWCGRLSLVYLISLAIGFIVAIVLLTEIFAFILSGLVETSS